MKPTFRNGLQVNPCRWILADRTTRTAGSRHAFIVGVNRRPRHLIPLKIYLRTVHTPCVYSTLLDVTRRRDVRTISRRGMFARVLSEYLALNSRRHMCISVYVSAKDRDRAVSFKLRNGINLMELRLSAQYAAAWNY